MILLMALTILVAQLGNLTLRQRELYLAKAEGQYTRELPVSPPRGMIYDRHMKPLAMNRPVHVLLIHYPYYNQPELLDKVSRLVGVSVDKIQKRVEQQSDRPYEPVRVVDQLTEQQYATFLERKQDFPGVEVQVEPVRYYPGSDLAAHLIGYVNEISQDDLNRLKSKGYVGGELIGQTGLEAYYESYLRGNPGVREVEVNNYFEPLGEVTRVEPRPGHNLVLTIDSELQHAAERALAWQMHRLQTIPNAGDGHAYPNAQAGAVVVMDVKTGAVLAMASQPAFDPNLFVGGISEQDWVALNHDSFQPLLNRAVQAAYQPGSTWKMLTGAAALTAGVTTPYERVFSGTGYEPTGQRDWVPWGHGWVDLAAALRLSSNIYFYEMGRRLGIERLGDFARGFGFGQSTGADLYEEVGGLVPDEAYREKHGWWLGQTTSAAIGQIFAATPLQLARYTAALANGGKLMRPYLVQAIQDSRGQVLQRTEPEQLGPLPVTPVALATVLEGMKQVNLPGGTSDFAIWPLPGIATAGKTGTAENPPKDDYGLYVGFAPVNDPEIAVAVVIEEAGHGASVSPVARTIFAEYFNVQLPPSDPARVPDDFATVVNSDNPGKR